MSNEFTAYVELDVAVSYHYAPGSPQTYWEPGEPASIEIESVVLHGTDILDRLDASTIERLEEEAMQHVASQMEDAEEARAGALYDERLADKERGQN